MSKLFALSLVLLVACGREPRDPKQYPISRAELEGEQVAQKTPADDPAELTYRRYCVGCHGDDGHGNGGTTGANLAAADSPLHTRSDAELFESVKNGKVGKVGTMPAHKPILSDDQIRAVIAYARASFSPSPP